MEHTHEHAPARRQVVRTGDDATDWDEAYGSIEQWWSGAVNSALVTEVWGLTPGSAIDIGCGEGADAIWLASQGWTVTAVDISAVAVTRAAAAAAEASVSVTFAAADVAAGLPGRFDLVSVFYPALRKSPAGSLSALLDAVAPGGRLLFVGHDLTGTDHAQKHGFDPADYLQVPDVLAALGDGWTVEVNENRPRVRPPGLDGPDMPDIVLRVRRSA